MTKLAETVALCARRQIGASAASSAGEIQSQCCPSLTCAEAIGVITMPDLGDHPWTVATLDPDQLLEASRRTLGHYNDHARSFWAGTHDHDVSQNVAALLRHLSGAGPHAILDFGCGPGRDLATFTELGHAAIGLDGASAFVELAREHSGCEVWEQDFLKLELPERRFDGVFANAALFHVPHQELARVLGQLWASLVPGGALFCSNPRGSNTQGWSGERYGCYLDLPTYRDLMTAARFVELEHYYRPSGQPRHRQPWLASVWRRPISTTATA